MLKSKIFAVCLAISGLCASAQSYTPTDSLNLAAAVKKVMPANADLNPESFYTFVCDYNADSRPDMVALLTDYDACTTEIYINDNSRARLYKRLDGFLCGEPTMARLSDCTVLCLATTWGGSGSEGYYVMFTPGGINCNSFCEGVTYAGRRDFNVVTSDYNMTTEYDTGLSIGHCWYTNYYYLDSDRKLRRYGARNITEAEFKKYGNVAPLYAALRNPDVNARIIGIQLRDNDIIEVNARSEESLGFTNYCASGRIVDGRIEWLIETSDGSIIGNGYINL